MIYSEEFKQLLTAHPVTYQLYWMFLLLMNYQFPLFQNFKYY